MTKRSPSHKRKSTKSDPVSMVDARIAARFIEDVGFLLCSVRSETSGVEGAVIYLSHGEYSRTEVEHGPKLLVALGDRPSQYAFADAVSVTLTTPPRILGMLPAAVAAQVVAFVAKNRNVLLLAWSLELDSLSALERLARP